MTQKKMKRIEEEKKARKRRRRNNTRKIRKSEKRGVRSKRREIPGKIMKLWNRKKDNFTVIWATHMIKINKYK